jgi:hypothetical protein
VEATAKLQVLALDRVSRALDRVFQGLELRRVSQGSLELCRVSPVQRALALSRLDLRANRAWVSQLLVDRHRFLAVERRHRFLVARQRRFLAVHQRQSQVARQRRFLAVHQRQSQVARQRRFRVESDSSGPGVLWYC